MVEHPGKARRNRVDAGCEKSVGAPHHRVLLVNEGRDFAQRRRQDRRDGGIAAETDDRRRPGACEQTQALHGADAEQSRRARQRQWVAPAHGGAGDDVDVARRKSSAVALGANVRREGGAHAPAAERLGKRFGGKQVPAGSAGGEENKRHATWSVSAVEIRPPLGRVRMPPPPRATQRAGAHASRRAAYPCRRRAKSSTSRRTK
jgi:hypothetical protein